MLLLSTHSIFEEKKISYLQNNFQVPDKKREINQKYIKFKEKKLSFREKLF